MGLVADTPLSCTPSPAAGANRCWCVPIFISPLISLISSQPVIPGHEIVGIVKHVGPKVTEFKIGDRVGVGAQIGSCLDCANCKNDNEN